MRKKMRLVHDLRFKPEGVVPRGTIVRVVSDVKPWIKPDTVEIDTGLGFTAPCLLSWLKPPK